MRYNSLLTSDDINYGSLLISELGLSLDVLSFLTQARFRVGDKGERHISTIGELVSAGKDELNDKAHAYFDMTKAMEILQEIEEKLARLGLKLSGSDFTVGDVRISMLDLSGEEFKKLRKITDRLKTLDDLITYGIRGIYRVYGKGDTKFIESIEAALEKYGLKLEGSHRKINFEKAFRRKYELTRGEPAKLPQTPLKTQPRPAVSDKPAAKKPEAKQKQPAKEGEYRQNVHFRYQDLSEMTSQQKLAAQIDNLFLPAKLVQKLHGAGYHTLGSLVNASHDELREAITESAIKAVVLEMSRHGMAMPKSNYTVVERNQIVPTERFEKVQQRRFKRTNHVNITVQNLKDESSDNDDEDSL